MFKLIPRLLLKRAEKRIGVMLDYVSYILDASIPLLIRYNKIFSFLDPRKHALPLAYHAARLRGALTSDCGACVQAEVNLARNAGLSDAEIKNVLLGQTDHLDRVIVAVMNLSDAVTKERIDDAPSREVIRRAYGDKALIEIAFAMNGATLLPGIKRALGYSVTCDPDLQKYLYRP